ncbi:1-deoxy-D-xylulose-5-phosphate synthase [Xanthomonas translucens pv. undulosa]|uniref:1-deoxy-D-xylulose-5-phosphate synthase n=1 Tax=Xanthomonas campestris pv. translucens TaxID=343 RepID=UPI00071E7D86|nr:1-deoxy-D-xylulose-5-phosphate synthase [Xanthomonas translucens]AVY67085.1 1-deoxy-D-xylulose-5-phosphate synthase [Xanthomonas translucens pv. undulosa]QSQ40728.1 1-deoxy-D-xylulose-5-phosphate synthase [Xanthomonas translucens pv. translucens]QSQ48077.1 1-deoxy-D-xylulose-5-phosphate synthase [Xanthomonas translucens pv. undulosa]UPU48091.1 1-deoxy-D-xylulose-5-phosphate synthase [Xanthomonas translucens pv. undulosa]WLA02480.1 1-deoxy-D-xylulose-5-phosphate synthase [Xanthomonas translu
MIDPTRYPRLARIQIPAELRRFEESELPAIAEELRAYLIECVGKSGGHFGAGLGVIELTVALHYLYDTPVDRLVWDVGHQTYPHKILTGRRDQIHSVKQAGGVAPFPKREESEYDTFGVGHSSTSISAALGMAIALQRAGDERKVVAVIGDGAMTAGMAYEALNHAGGMDPEPNLLVILNDNRMSISEAVGGVTKMLGRMSGSKTLNAIREGGKKILGDKKNNPTARFVRRWEEHWKGMFVPSTLFEEMGFHYTGPIDGHDLPALIGALKTLQTLKGAQLLHVITTKGKGYELAEGDQIGYHAVGPFDPSKGLVSKPGAKATTYTDVFGDWICDMAAAEPALLAITPAMREGSGLVRFSKEYPQRYFDVAIAEQHAVTLAAGMATQGAKPVVAIYSTFLQRGYDQLVHDVAVQQLDVLFAIDRGGVVGPDGATHAGNLDLSFLRCVPHLVLMAPADEAECRQMLSTGLRHAGPAAVRYPRGIGPGVAPGTALETLPIGKAQLRVQGATLALLAFGSTVAAAEQVGRELGLSVVNMRFVKPLDRALLLELARSHDGFVTIEDNVVAGGAGAGVAELLNAEGVLRPLLHLGLPDAFQHHASREQLLAEAGIDAAGIRAAILARWPQLAAGANPPCTAAG